MSKNNFKKEIQQKYKGRGNTWIRIESDSPAYQSFLSLIPSCEEGKTFLNHVNREGFGWARFSKVEGTKDNPLELFEVRFKGSKIDHPDNILTVEYSVSKNFKLLGNTPVKLDLETDPSNRKQKQVKKDFKRKIENNTESIEIDKTDVVKEIRLIKESALTKPCDKELENWYEFLKLNGLYEENV